MAIQMGKALAFTAVSGLVAGLAGCGPDKPAENPTGGTDTAAQPAGAKECCKGKNECSGKGRCQTADNACAGKNSCKNKGGCNKGCEEAAPAPTAAPQ